MPTPTVQAQRQPTRQRRGEQPAARRKAGRAATARRLSQTTPWACAALVVAALSCTMLPSAPASAIAWQRNGGQHHVFAEAFGNGLLASLNYEYRYAGAATFRIGFLPGFGSGEDAANLAVPVSVGVLAGTVAHMLDVAVGATMVPDATEPLLLTANIGYRFISTDGLVFRAFATPIFQLNAGSAFLWGGASLGYTFD